jgi:hypothetical protein
VPAVAVSTGKTGTEEDADEQRAEEVEPSRDDVDSDEGGEGDGEAKDPSEEADKDLGDEPVDTAPSAGSNLIAGAGAVVSAGLGLASLTGTWLSDLMSARQELIGRVNSTVDPTTGMSADSPSEQIANLYGSPWHTTALFNGFFALAAVIVASAILLRPVVRKNSQKSAPWASAVAAGGLVLGVLGLLIAGAMWFDIFTEMPAVPEA